MKHRKNPIFLFVFVLILFVTIVFPVSQDVNAMELGTSSTDEELDSYQEGLEKLNLKRLLSGLLTFLAESGQSEFYWGSEITNASDLMTEFEMLMSVTYTLLSGEELFFQTVPYNQHMLQEAILCRSNSDPSFLLVMVTAEQIIYVSLPYTPYFAKQNVDFPNY